MLDCSRPTFNGSLLSHSIKLTGQCTGKLVQQFIQLAVCPSVAIPYILGPGTRLPRVRDGLHLIFVVEKAD
jgi:hypothetical protein